jgi:hypothetical protein
MKNAFPQELLPFYEHFAEQDIEPDYDPQADCISVPVLIRETWCVVKISTHPDLGAVAVRMDFPYIGVEPLQHVIRELLARINPGLSLGAFHLDEEGEIFFLAIHLIKNSELTREIADDLIGAAIILSVHAHCALTRCLYAGSSAEEALLMAELDDKGIIESSD